MLIMSSGAKWEYQIPFNRREEDVLGLGDGKKGKYMLILTIANAIGPWHPSLQISRRKFHRAKVHEVHYCIKIKWPLNITQWKQMIHSIKYYWEETIKEIQNRKRTCTRENVLYKFTNCWKKQDDKIYNLLGLKQIKTLQLYMLGYLENI